MRGMLACLPDPDQELLLKAALLDGDAAIDSWNAWRARVPIDRMDFASQRLLPLLLHRLQKLGVDHPDLRRYQSVARYVWLDNQLRVRLARQVLEQFADAGIPAMPLKGLALAPLYYGDFRLRAMNDLDILVPTASAGAASRVLNRDGWRSPFEELLQSSSYWPTRHAAQFTNAQGVEIDLHWHVSHECCTADADDAFWRHAQPLIFNGFETKTLSDTDHLFHTCIHGARPNEVSPIRWIADSAQILRAGTIDWQRLLDQGKSFNLIHRLQFTLGYLRSAFALPIPEPVIAQLTATRPGGLELFEERTAFSRLPNVVKSSVLRYIHYRRNMAHRAGDRGFVRYLQESFGTGSLGETLLWVAQRTRQGWPDRSPPPVKVRTDQ